MSQTDDDLALLMALMAEVVGMLNRADPDGMDKLLRANRLQLRQFPPDTRPGSVLRRKVAFLEQAMGRQAPEKEP